MKDSLKAKLIVILIIAVIAFCISSAFASLTITEDRESYKITHIENDSFEPNYINKVPTILPKVETNNTTTTNTTDYDLDDNGDDTYDNISYTYSEDEENWKDE